MELQDFVTSSIKWGYDAIADDIDLSTQIQKKLIELGFLESSADGKFGPISASALKEFQVEMKINELDFLGAITAKKLLETNPDDIPKDSLQLNNSIASRIIKYMQSKKYQIFTKPKEYNIVYIEGINENWNLNNDAPNVFNDQRIVIEIVDGVPKIVNHWQATTEPGSHYTYRPMNPGGAARIKFGQYQAWSLGLHGNSDRHEALVQVAPVTVHRDFNKDFKRTGDKLDTGLFGINQHWGYDAPSNDIKTTSAGCLVGRRREGHREFMSIIKQDRRCILNSNYLFYTTIIPGNDLLEKFPA